MKLELDDLMSLKTEAEKAARLAGDYIQGQLGKVKSKNKTTGTSLASQVVTEVDLHSQKIILDKLKEATKKYDLGTLSEEEPENKSRFFKDYFWCIDPLDGTLCFIEQKSGYTVSIALVRKSGKPVLGIVYDPINNSSYSAIEGAGAFKNDLEFNLHSHDQSILTFYHDRSFADHPAGRKMLEHLEKNSIRLGYDKLKVCSVGGSVIHALYCIENAPAFYYKNPKRSEGGGSLWDFAATACIVNEAEGVAKNAHLGPLDLNRKDSTFMNHEGVLFASHEALANSVSQLSKKILL